MLDRMKNFGVSALVLGWLVCVTGCSTFNRDWQVAATQPTPTDSLAGRWEGKWVSAHNGHSGRLRAIIRPTPDGQYEVNYHANYGLIFSFGMPMHLAPQPAPGGWTFSGTENLGGIYGNYNYDGKASPTNFFSTYKARLDHGTFQMTRPQP